MSGTAVVTRQGEANAVPGTDLGAVEVVIDFFLELALVAPHHPADLDDVAQRTHRTNIVVVGQFKLNDVGIRDSGGNLTGADLGKYILGLEIFRQERDLEP